MTNTKIKSIFRRSFKIFFYLFLAAAVVGIINGHDDPYIIPSLIAMAVAFSLIPVCIVVILRVYNLLIYGRLVIEEGKE